MRPYRCKACLKRFLRRRPPIGGFDGRVAEASGAPKPASDARAHAPFVAKEATDEFGELIREIAAAEHAESGEKPLP